MSDSLSYLNPKAQSNYWLSHSSFRCKPSRTTVPFPIHPKTSAIVRISYTPRQSSHSNHDTHDMLYNFAYCDLNLGTFERSENALALKPFRTIRQKNTFGPLTNFSQIGLQPKAKASKTTTRANTLKADTTIGTGKQWTRPTMVSCCRRLTIVPCLYPPRHHESLRDRAKQR